MLKQRFTGTEKEWEEDNNRIFIEEVRFCDEMDKKNKEPHEAANKRIDELVALVDSLRNEIRHLQEGAECHVACSGEGTYECDVNRLCAACRLRRAEEGLKEKEQVITNLVDKLLYRTQRWGLWWEQMDKKPKGEYVEYDAVVNAIRHHTGIKKEER